MPFLGPQLLHLLRGLVPVQIARISQMLVLRTPGSQLVFSSPDKGTAGRGGAQNFRRSPRGNKSSPLPCPGTRRGLTWPEVFPTASPKALRDAARLSPSNSQPHSDAYQELPPSSKMASSLSRHLRQPPHWPP